MPNPPQKISVPVDRIEQPLDLGDLCYFLTAHRVNPYKDTEEMVAAVFDRVPRSRRVNFCQEYDRCRTFMDVWKTGIAPFESSDAMILLQNNGRYWVSEGKHRVCAASQGDVLFLYIDLTRPFSLTSHMIRGYLGVGFIGPDLSHQWSSLAPGIDVRECITQVPKPRRWRKPHRESHRVEVQIASSIPFGKIWLAKFPLHMGFPDVAHKTDCFRRGLLRKSHERWLFG